MYALTLSAKRTVCLQNKLHLFPQKPQINEATTILQNSFDFRFERKAVISKHGKKGGHKLNVSHPDRQSPQQPHRNAKKSAKN